jgi:hypothetical protein
MAAKLFLFLRILSHSMESEILRAALSFNTLLADLLEALDEQWIMNQGRFRPGGRIDLNTLGDMVWLEQFR